MSLYEVESADLDFVYGINDNKFYRNEIVQMLTLPLTQWRGIESRKEGVLTHNPVKTSRLAN
jgi:hypothetical protein